jgi:spermidine/putrescine transport system substrate-binding protein
MRRSPKTLIAIASAITLFAVVMIFGCRSNGPNPPRKELRVLAWVGYEEPEIVEPFEREFGVKVLTETFTGADKMFAKLTNSPNAYDVVVIDPEYISKLHSAGLLSELNPNEFKFDKYIDPLRDFPLCRIDGKMYAVLVRFGVNALVYNTEKLTKEEVSSYDILWSPKVKGRVGIWDWYLPNMGVLSLSAGFVPPYHLTDEQFGKLKNRLETLRPQVRAIMGSFSDINAAFARGDIWIAPALGEHTAAVLSEDGHPIDWVVPKEGGIMWIETLGIPPLASNRPTALDYIRYIQRPDVQAKLTWRRAYRSNIPNTEGIALLSQTQQNALKVHNGIEATALVNSIQVRRLPEDGSGKLAESAWQAEWQRFKAGK